MVYSSQNPSAGLLLGSRAEILPGQPAPDLNGAGGPAFAARTRGGTASDLFAIICNSGFPPRIDAVPSMRTIDHSSVLRMVDSGPVLWPQDDTQYYAFAYQRPSAPRMKTSIDEVHPLISEDAVNHFFVTPMVGALGAFERSGMVHGAIRTTNIFWRIGSSTVPQLGECMSSPPGVGQPALFETIERGMSMPLGRGTGKHVDDCYAFGVCLALLLMGQNPLQGMDDFAITQMKIERGSFAALTGNKRLAASHIELLRGLLADDARQRWTANDLEQWLNGRRLTPKNTDSGRRAQRLTEFAGKEYYQVRPLAAAMAHHVGEAAQMIENGVLDKWLRRAMGDEDRANALEEAKSSLKETGKNANYEEQLVARACIALDPVGPIRYRGLSVMPGGVAAMLIEGVMHGHNLQVLSEIILSQLVTFWVEMQGDEKKEDLPLAQQFERMRGVIERVSLGNGIERAVYELNPGIPCLSPALRAHFVTSPKALTAALERVANSGNRMAEPMDRHIAAFLVARDRRSETIFEPMTTPEHLPRRGLALLALYADLQQKYGPESMPGIAAWLLPRLEPAIQRYLGKTLREKLQTQMREAALGGSLAALQRIVDDQSRVEYDQQQFRAARMLYLNIMKEIANIEHKLNNRDIVVRGIGKPMAASLSSFLAIILIFVAILRAVWQNMGM